MDKNTSQRTLNQQDTDNFNTTTQCDVLLHVVIRKILPEETVIFIKKNYNFDNKKIAGALSNRYCEHNNKEFYMQFMS